MARSTPLVLLQQRTADLVTQDLRSESTVIYRLCEPILEAVRVGHSHRSIHQAITSGGLEITAANYRSALQRARNSRRSGSLASAEETGRAERAVEAAERADATDDFDAPSPKSETSVKSEHSHERVSVVSSGDSSGTSSATRVMDSLRRAQEVASKDYRRIAIDNYRQRLRKPSPKDLS